MRVFAVFSHQSLSLSPHPSSRLGVGAQKQQLYLHTLYIKEAFVMGLAHVTFQSPPAPLSLDPRDRQLYLLKKKKLGVGIISEKPPVNRVSFCRCLIR